MTGHGRLLIAALLLGGAATPVLAEPAGVAALMKQAQFWQAKGRTDLARQALNRVLAIDPGNAAARRALAGTVPAKLAAPKKEAEPANKRVASAPVDTSGNARAAGFAALDGGDIATASARFQAALKINPNDADAIGGLGLARLRADRFAEARTLLARASRIGNAAKWASALQSAGFYADLRSAEAARNANRLDEAETLARKVANSDFKDRALAQTLLGDILSRQGKFSEAAAVYAQAASSGNSGAAEASAGLRAKAARERAMQALAGGDVAGAERFFQSAIVADPGDPWMRYEYSRFLVSQRRTASAIATMAPLSNSSSPEALFAAALFANQIDKPAEADALMARIPAGQLTEPMRSFMVEVKTGEAIARAKQLYDNGRTAEAMNGLRSVASRPNLSVGTLGALAQAFADMGDIGGAQALAEQALQLPTVEADAYQPIVAVLARTGQDATAASLVQRFTTEGGVSPAAGQLAATLAATQADRLRLAGQNATAFDVLQQAWAAAPNNTDILGALARLYQGGGMPAQAVQVYNLLLGQKPGDLAAMIGMADAASAMRDFDRARTVIANAIAVAPQDPEVYLAAARIEEARGDKRAALRYLKQARALSGHSNMLVNGGAFPSGNPFAAGPGGAGPQQAMAINPFALSGNPTPAPYAAPAGAMIPPPTYMGASNPSFAPVATPFYAQAPAGTGSAPATDSTLDRIDREIAELAGETGPSLQASTRFRNRSGESGLSKLTEIGATVTGSVPFGGGKISASASPTVIDAGRASRSGLARFGTNPTAEAIGIEAQQPSALAPAKTQHDAGVAFSVGFESGAFKADVGSTPVGFDKVNVQGGATFSPKISENVTIAIHGERRPVTDSIISYASAIDPVTGMRWGSVMRAGGGGSLSFDRNGNGIYADAAYRHYDGENVRSNHAIEANIGGYLNAYRSANTTVTLGANVNYQAYGNNQNFFSFGHGGYFSPQSFISIAFPMRYATAFGKWKINADAALGYQSYEQDEVAIYPTRPDLQGQLDFLKTQNSDVLARYDSISKSGFAFSGSATASYQLAPTTNLGGEIRYNTFGVYDELQTMLKITQALGGGGR